MKNSLLCFIIFLLAVDSFAQSKRTYIKGIIVSDSSSVENIHVINSTTNKATTSDFKGRFRISVKENDTITFSAIQFENKVIIITKNHIKNLSIIVSIKSAINQLDEILIKKSKNMAGNLGLPNADKKPLNKIESRLNYHATSSLARVFLGILLREKGNINDIYYITSGKRKKDRILTKLREKDTYNIYVQQEIQKIRVHFKDGFFTETLKIPKQEIDYFIKFCDANNLIYLFNKNRTLEIIDIFIKKSKPYVKKLENEE